VLAVAKFVPGLSIVSIPMAGAMGTTYRTFLTYDSVGAALWSGTGLIIGALFAPQIDMVLAGAGRLGKMAIVVIGALLLLYASYRWIRRRQLIKKLATARMDVDELYKLIVAGQPPVLFDIRSREKRKLDPFVIPGTQFADERQLNEIIAKYSPEQKLVIYCSCPNEISAAWMAKQLNEAGFSDVLPLRGGNSSRSRTSRWTRSTPAWRRRCNTSFTARAARDASCASCASTPALLHPKTEGAV
jgi:rhodanese-related sulfurtransferase